MLKPTHIAIADTNLSNFGSDLEKNIRQHAGDGEPAWKTAGKQTGIEGWRIKQFKLVPVPANLLGQFYNGDSYIVLKTVITDTGSNWDVFFWLGSETTQDEAGTAAYKTVELDDHLGGKPIQHREVEGHESQQFVSLFSSKGGIRVLKGGFETGFAHVTADKYTPRLLQVTASSFKDVRVQEVPLAFSSLHSSDVFILDAGLKIYQLNGAGAKPAEKNKAALFSNAIRDEREGQADVDVIEDTEGFKDSQFWTFFGGFQKIAKEAPVHQAEQAIRVLYKISDSTGSLTFTKIAEGTINKSHLNPNDAFVLDAGFEVFVWVGNGASDQERKSALQLASDYLKKHNRPNFLPITRLQQGSENEFFNALLA